jgi:small subunit ribosomal protein S4
MRLKEKQKLRFNYGLGEKQLVNYMKQAKKTKGATGRVLLQLLEMRLDNILFRLGLAKTIVSARQVVSHRHITVNTRVVSIPSYQCEPGDVVGVRLRCPLPYPIRRLYTELRWGSAPERQKRELVQEACKTIPRGLALTWEKFALSGDLEARVLGISGETTISGLNELFVIEYYSRKI